jgi:hypothetical protein
MFKFLLTEPTIVVPNKKIPGPDDGDEYDDDEDETDIPVTPPNTTTGQSNENVYNKNPHDGNTSQNLIPHSYAVMALFIMLALSLTTGFSIMFFYCARHKKHPYVTGRSVLTFSNPNYSASSSDVGTNTSQADKRQFLWKRLKYDKSQVRNQH